VPDEGLLADIPDYGIRLDKNGLFWHQGQPVLNDKVQLIFAQHLTRLDDGAYALVLGPDRCVIDLEDAPYVVRRVQVVCDDDGAPARVGLTLSDATEEDLDPATLEISVESVLYCRVKQGEHRARFDRAPYVALAEHVVELDRGFGLKLRGEVYEVKAAGATRAP